MFQDSLELKSFVNLEDWQKIQDNLSEVLEITVRTFSPAGDLLCNISRPNRLYDEILPIVSEHFKYLTTYFVESKIENLSNIKKEINLRCLFDLDAFIVPIKAAGDRIIAYVMLGPVILKNRKAISEYAEEAKKHGIELNRLEDALIELNVFSYNKINAIIKLIKSIFSHMAQTGYHKKRLGEIKPEVIELDPLFSRYYEEKILNSLLNTCSLALDADSGSVMILDKKTNALHIKVSSKLDKDIVDNTNIKMGEGIAGIAAATAESIILPKDKDKNGLSKKMKRGYIRSSLIVPFNKGSSHDIYGVINLNIVRKDREFSEWDVALAKELINMTSIALSPLTKPAAE